MSIEDSTEYRQPNGQYYADPIPRPPVNREQRFSADNLCPICSGHKDMKQGEGVRCFGFYSNDWSYAHCTREELAGDLEFNENSETFAHRLDGKCRCGELHEFDPVTPPPTPKPPDKNTYGDPDETHEYRWRDGSPHSQVCRRKNGKRKSLWFEASTQAFQSLHILFESGLHIDQFAQNEAIFASFVVAQNIGTSLRG